MFYKEEQFWQSKITQNSHVAEKWHSNCMLDIYIFNFILSFSNSNIWLFFKVQIQILKRYNSDKIIVLHWCINDNYNFHSFN